MLRILLVLVGICLPHALLGQGHGTVVRAGAGIDAGGATVVGGQLELVDFGTSSSVELAVAVFEASLIEDYEGAASSGPIIPPPPQYHEDTRVRGVGSIASVLIGQGPSESRGPYVALGLGLGAFDVDWYVESLDDNRLGSPRPGGGSLREEDGLLLGGLGSLGVGFRVHRRVDIRAQALTLMTPSTDTREDLKLLATFMLTAGVGI